VGGATPNADATLNLGIAEGLVWALTPTKSPSHPVPFGSATQALTSSFTDTAKPKLVNYAPRPTSGRRKPTSRSRRWSALLFPLKSLPITGAIPDCL
jgi:hypothetical protein